MSDISLLYRTKTAKRPPTLWVQVWEVFAPYCLPTEPGEYQSEETFPSRELAEEDAFSEMRAFPSGFEEGVRFVGAEPA